MIRTAATVFLLLLACLSAAATEAGWALLREGGQVVLISNANAPGHGDPANFDIESCATQRNLSDRGRQQARRMGALFFARAAPIEEVLTSRYCRAVETATLAFGDAEPLDALDYFEPGSEAGEAQLEALRERVTAYTGAGNLVMVTHPEVIESLTGVLPREAEAVILSRSAERIDVAARIRFN
ncbi:histidine phosphatase family protein [Chelativorans sp. AA-79]|uniref:histidine phosphatase family protein n=1 Tax=Chelativorans sp. AA-79 TaxID=3028735 RepID=UPI0023F711AF|nr:histidine phosphatase family protein [Chelativorans sp. AA-79]WEX11451.1 histidine phosphatase family protein [Chelativorans sp. AA-79]